MANIVQEALTSDGAQMLSELSDEVITWEGSDYPALISDPSVGVDLESGGLMARGEFSAKVLRSAFNSGAGPFPQDGDVITYDGDTFVTPNATRQRKDSAFIIFDLETNL